MKTSNLIIALFLAAAAIAAGSCSKDDIKYYDAAQNAIRFPMDMGYSSSDTTFYASYSFMEDPFAESAEVDIPLEIMGLTAPTERNVKYTIDPEKTTAPKSSYEVLAAVVPAQEMTGYIRVKVLNESQLQDQSYQIKFILEASEEFKLGPKHNLTANFSWNNSLPKPSVTSLIRSYNMLVAGETNFISTSLNSYSTSAHKAIVAALGWDDWDDASIHGSSANPASYNYKYLPRYSMIYNGDLYKAYAAKLRDYLEAYNDAHPNAPLLHDGGTLIGKPVEARTY